MKVDDNKQPLISIDVVPVRFNAATGQLEVGTGRRLFKPFVGQQALEGVIPVTSNIVVRTETGMHRVVSFSEALHVA